MSHLTAAETLDLGKVTSLSKGWTISLSGDERRSWRSRRLARPTSNRSHLIPHSSSKGKHGRLRNALSGPPRAIHHGEHLLRAIVLLNRKGLFRGSMDIYGRAKALQSPCKPQSMSGASGPSGYE